MAINISNIKAAGISGTVIPNPTPTPTPTPAPAPSGDPYFNYVNMLIENTETNNQSNASYVDSSANSFTISTVGNNGQGSFSPFYSNGYWSYSFNGSSDYLTGSDVILPAASNFTIEAWIYVTDSTVRQSIYIQEVSTTTITPVTGRLLFSYRGDVGGTLNLFIGGAVTNMDISSVASIPTFTWTHVAATRTGNNYKLYINGVEDGSGTSSTSIVQEGWSIGARRALISTGPFYFNGQINSLRISNSAIYTGNFTPSTSPLTAPSGTLFLTCQSNNFIDRSSNNYSITTNGSPRIIRFSPFLLPTPYSTSTNGGSRYFDGAVDYMSVANNAAFNFGTGDFTVECWIYPTAADAGIIYETANSPASGAAGLFIQFNADRTVSAGQAFGSAVVISPAIPLFSWYHVAVVRNASVWNLYINGQDRTIASSGATLNATGATTIGGNARNTTDTFNGHISSLRVVKGTAVYSTAFSPTPPLTAITNTSLLTAQTNGLVDNSGNSLVVTGIGNTTNTSFGPIGSTNLDPFGAVPSGYWSNYFDGDNDYLTMPDASWFDFGAGNFTIEFFMYSLQSKTARITSQQGSSGTGVVMARVGGTNMNFVVQNSSGTTLVNLSSAAGSIPVGSWRHVAIVRNGNVFTIYINGTSAATTTAAVTLPNVVEPFAIGAYLDVTPSEFFNGYISNLRVVKGTAVYTGNFTPSTTPLTAISGTSLLTCRNESVLVDNSLNGNPITKFGAVSGSVFTPLSSPNGGSLYFDGTGDYATVANNDILNMGSSDFTMECWFYPHVTPNGSIFGKRANSAAFAGVILGFNNSLAPRVIASMNGTSWGVDITSVISCNLLKWNHIAVVRKQSTWRLYVNGVQGAAGTLAGTVVTNTAAFSLGASAADGSNTITQSYISNARVVKGTAVYDSDFTPSTAPLTAISNTSLLLNYQNAGIYDAVGNTNFSTEGNSRVSTTRAKFGTASIYFDGSGDYLTTNDNASNLLSFGTGNFTVEFWMNLVAIPVASTAILFDYRPASTQGLYPTAYINSSGKLIYFTNGSDRIISVTTLTTNTWYHVVVCRSGTSTRLFLNGVQEGSTYSDSNKYVTGGLRPVIAGSGFSLGSGSLNGYLQDFRVTNGIARYTANFTPPTTPFPTN